MTDLLESAVREHWWAAVSALYPITGDLGLAEDAVQEACVAALRQWSTDGVPTNPAGWLAAVARRKAIDRIRRDHRRSEREAVMMREFVGPGESSDSAADPSEDMLRLVFLCCHPALDASARIALTLRSVCGLSTSEIAAAFLVPDATMTKRLVRAKAKIRDSAIPFRLPTSPELQSRLAGVLRVAYLLFTEGHTATSGEQLLRTDLCDTAIGLARVLSTLLPGEPEVRGLLALLLLTDARRSARTDTEGELILLENQDRSRWDQAKLAEGRALLEDALSTARPGPYQIHAAIAACHADAANIQDTDWRQIALLYTELLRYEPTAVVEANRAVAVAMSEGPLAGLVILDAIAGHPQLRRWPQLHIARAELLTRAGRPDDAAAAFREALALEPASTTRTFIHRRLNELADGKP